MAYAGRKSNGWCFVIAMLLPGVALSQSDRPNVLFICADDLRPALGCYGDPIARTPHLDRLASRAMVFTRAYCQQAVCNPSRASALTGLRPDSTGVYDNGRHFREHVPGVLTLPQHFKEHGYHTQAVGKIYHSSWKSAYCGDRLDDPPSWSAPSWWPSAQYYYSPEGQRIAREIFLRNPSCGLRRGGMCLHNRLQSEHRDPTISGDEWSEHFVMGPVSEAPDVEDGVLYDGQVADRTIETLRRIKDKPFFLAVGFLRPHIPYVAPKKYWDLYDAQRIPLSPNRTRPQGVPPVAMQAGLGIRTYEGVPQTGPINEDLARHLRQGYYACVSYVDAQVGRIVDELDRLGLSRNTIIVFWGDHGFHLGEQGHWDKETNFETAARVPLIISAPGMKAAGQRTDALVELVDIFPTLCQLSDLSLPVASEGYGLAPLLDNPNRPWKMAAFSQYPRAGGITGRSIRTGRHRLTLWQRGEDPAAIVGRELYDYESDPWEQTNLAEEPRQADLVETLTVQLRQGWRKVLPVNPSDITQDRNSNTP